MFRLQLTRNLQFCRGRSCSTAVLEKWIASPKSLTLTDSIRYEHLSDLYITLPTRDGTRKPYKSPETSSPLGYGHHLAFFHPRTPESQLRRDGTDGNFCPPEPFVRRMWAGGSIAWNNENPLVIGGQATAKATISAVKKKGFESRENQKMIFVDQRFEIITEGARANTPSIVEQRSHVYLSDTYETEAEDSRVARQGELLFE